jgi:DNA polymerase III delta prime subunit
MEGLGLPRRIERILQTMVDTPATRSHLLMIGPPGSGKTTSARYFVEALHGSSKSFFGRALFLNSSDERGLEAVRSRVYPFIRSSFDALFVSTGPKVIVFDEAETLTDQAQIALRPLLDMNPQKVLIIFLCNSISRIHESIVHKFLTIPFEAPKHEDFQVRIQKILGEERGSAMSGLDIQFRRGDIRFFILNPGRFQDCAKLWHELFTVHSSQIRGIFDKIVPKWVFSDLAIFCLFAAKSLSVLTPDALSEMLRITDTDFIKQCNPKLRSQLLSSWFETHIRAKLEEWPPKQKLEAGEPA